VATSSRRRRTSPTTSSDGVVVVVESPISIGRSILLVALLPFYELRNIYIYIYVYVSIYDRIRN
jgi:hypothetical protein